MADLTMCNSSDCVVKASCIRSTAKPRKEYQSYFSAPLRVTAPGGYCEYFWYNGVDRRSGTERPSFPKKGEVGVKYYRMPGNGNKPIVDRRING